MSRLLTASGQDHWRVRGGRGGPNGQPLPRSLLPAAKPVIAGSSCEQARKQKSPGLPQAGEKITPRAARPEADGIGRGLPSPGAGPPASAYGTQSPQPWGCREGAGTRGSWLRCPCQDFSTSEAVGLPPPPPSHIRRRFPGGGRTSGGQSGRSGDLTED